jgi:hypothetical protein
MKHTTYRFPETLRFKHLKKHEIFCFPGGHSTPVMGPYIKLSARRYAPVTVTWCGDRYEPRLNDRPVHLVGTINVPVTDRFDLHEPFYGSGVPPCQAEA